MKKNNKSLASVGVKCRERGMRRPVESSSQRGVRKCPYYDILPLDQKKKAVY